MYVIRKIAGIATSPRHGPIRMFATVVVMQLAVLLPMYFWSKDNGPGTKLLDPPTLIQTTVFNIVGLTMVLCIGWTGVMAAGKHFLHPFRQHTRHEHCLSEFGVMLLWGVGNVIVGALLALQTIDPHAKSTGLAKHFSSQVGTAQYYRSGIQTWLASLVLISLGYVAVQVTKWALEFHEIKDVLKSRGIPLPDKHAKIRSANQQEQLPAPQGQVVVQNGRWSPATASTSGGRR